MTGKHSVTMQTVGELYATQTIVPDAMRRECGDDLSATVEVHRVHHSFGTYVTAYYRIRTVTS